MAEDNLTEVMGKEQVLLFVEKVFICIHSFPLMLQIGISKLKSASPNS